MGGISVSAFVFRDVIRYILPTIIALGLYVPYFVPEGRELSIETLLLFSVVLGYVVYSPISYLASTFQISILKYVPRLSIYQHKKRRMWWTTNWDYDELWTNLEQQERDYLYLTMSYIEFFRLSGFYFFIYMVINLIYFISSLYTSFTLGEFSGISFGSFIVQLLTYKTQMLGNWNASTLIVIVLSTILFYFLYASSSSEYGILFVDGGFFPKFAEKYQKKIGNIARSIWGTVYEIYGDERNPLPAVEVSLLGNDNELVSKSTTDDSGDFQFEDKFKSCLNIECKLEISDTQWSGSTPIKLTVMKIPNFEIVATKK